MNETIMTAEQVLQGSSWEFGSVNIYGDILMVTLIIVMITLLFFAVVVNNAIRSVLRLTIPNYEKQRKEEQVTKSVHAKARWNKLLGLRPIEEEKDIEIDHEFDGIKELDNPVPIWFNALFYGTITFGLIYLMVYHVFGWGLLQDQEYQHEMAVAEKAKQEYLAQAANLIDESSVEVNLDMAAAGKAIFAANCVACHGANGEGGIGPNLADKFWLHGGEIKDIFKTVKYGIPAKGMVPWEQTLTPGQIAEVSNYILTLRGTNPANAKAAEGEEVVYEQAGEEVKADENSDTASSENN